MALTEQQLTAAGYTSLEAIRAATVSAAELLGWQDRIGSLEVGKLADIIATRGNPLSDIKQLEHVSFVMKGGIVVKDERKSNSMRCTWPDTAGFSTSFEIQS